MRRAVVAASVAVFFACAVAVGDGGPAMFLPGESVRTVFDADGDTRVAGIGLVAGMRFTASAKATKGSAAKPTLTFLRPDGTLVEPGRALRASAGSSQLTNYAADRTGVWRMTVSTPPAGGGGVDIAVRTKAPTKASGKAVVADAVAGADVPFDALPGTIAAAITVKCAARPSWTPRIELFSPSGATLGAVDGTKSTAVLRNVELPEAGTYRVRVTGGVGAVKLAASLRPPKARKGIEWKDVESPPTVTGFQPTSTTNDSLTSFQLHGVGFTAQHLVLFNQGTSTRTAQAVYQTTSYGAMLQTELAGVPAGAYTLQVRTPAGNTVTFPGTLTVANRPPAVASIYPPFFPQGQGLPVTVTGAGFDPGATFAVRRTSDQTQLTSSVTLRSGHQRVDLSVSTPQYLTGPCDLVVSEPGGETRTFPSVIDVVGWRAAPFPLVTYTASDAASRFWPRDAACDDAAGAVCLALKEGTGVRFTLLDASTLLPRDTTKLTPTSGTFDNPRVAFDPTSRTWALTYVATLSGSAEARVRVVDAADLDLVRGSATLDSSRYVFSTDAAADPDRGGFLVVWDRIASDTGPAEIRGRRIDGSGVLGGTAARLLAAHSGIYALEPAVARQSAGKYVVVYSGADSAAIAARRVVVDGDGAAILGTGDAVCASHATWYQLFQPEVAVSADGSVIVAFTYDDGASSAVYHPGCVPLAGATLDPGDLTTVDDDGDIPIGYIDSLVWNPARDEFVIACTTGFGTVIVRRITRAGAIRVAPISHEVEGIWGILWSGAAADRMGMVRLFDGDANGLYQPMGTMHAAGAALR